MKKLFLVLVVVLSTFSIVPTNAFAAPGQGAQTTIGTQTVPFDQVYREMQAILYGEYGGSQTGIDIANAYLCYWYGMDCQTVWFLHDYCGYTGNVSYAPRN